MATTWIFEYEGERSYVQRQDGLDRIAVLTWNTLEQDTTIVRTELEAVQLVQALGQELESRGWALIECCPERRQAGERRIGPPRAGPDRRRHGL
jgi:hypothetical protein